MDSWNWEEKKRKKKKKGKKFSSQNGKFGVKKRSLETQGELHVVRSHYTASRPNPHTGEAR